MKIHTKLLDRLARVFLEKHHNEGFDLAQQWYDGFIPEELKAELRLRIMKEAKQRAHKVPSKE